jgi:hypothetical protein
MLLPYPWNLAMPLLERLGSVLGEMPMNEINVVVDVRPSPDTAEIIVSKQKVAFNGEARLVGSPVESRVGLMTRKAKVSIFEFAEIGYGFAVGARVKNVGTVPFEITRVVFEHKFKQPQEVRFRSTVAQEIGGSIDFVPKDRSQTGSLHPGDERDYYLSQAMFDGVALLGISLPPDQFWIAAYNGTEEVGRIGGEYVRPFFDRSLIVFHRRVVPIFDTLLEAERLAIIRSVAPLRGMQPDRWTSVGAQPLEGTPRAFIVRANDDLVVVITQTEDKKVEIEDIVRKSFLEQIDTLGEESKQ